MRNKLFIIISWMVACFVLGLGLGSLSSLSNSDKDGIIERQSKTIHDQSETIKRQSTVIRDLYDRLSLVELD